MPPIPMPWGQDFSFQGATTIQVYLYTHTSRRRSSPGKLCVGSAVATCVLDHPWETMSWITPGKLCVASAFGNCVLSALVLSFWVPSFGSRLWPDMAHWARMCCITFGILCVASVLGNYVLHAHSLSRAWEVYAMGVSVCDAIVSEWSWSESRPMRTTRLLHYYSTSISLLFHYYAVVLRGYWFGEQSACRHLMSMHAYARICIHIHGNDAYACMYIYMHAYACMYIYMHAYACICMYIHGYACICKHMHTFLLLAACRVSYVFVSYRAIISQPCPHFL